MKNKGLIFTFLLAAAAGHTGETYESAGASSQLIFNLDNDNVFAALLEAGGDGYARGNLTFAAQGSEQHWFKFSTEYLIEHQDIDFDVDPREIWADQYAAGLTYQFFPSVNWPIALLANTYGSYTPSERVNDSQRIAEAIAYGGNAGFDVFFPSRTQVEALLRYDVIDFHNPFSPDEVDQGFGGSGFIKQYFGCQFNLIGGADFTEIYNNYYGAVNMLFPIASQAFQIGLKGQYNDPHHDLTRSLLGMVTFGIQPQQTCDETVTQKRETLSSFASRPAVYMPTVLAKLDEEGGAGLSVFIADDHFSLPSDTYDISGDFSAFGPGPLTFVFNGTLPANFSFNGSTGVFSAINAAPFLGSFSGSVTATNSKGQTVTSNVFTITWQFP